MEWFGRLRTVTAFLITVGLVLPAAASMKGQAAAQQVSEDSYRDYLDLWLYTHPGDDRGYGPEHDPAQANIAGLFASYGLDVTLEPFYYSSSWYYNVVGTKLGTTYPDQIYVLGAHYDSVNNPGADDDASGVALLLETARIITQYDSEYTIRFVAFDREEQGLVGSSAYVQDHLLDDILGMVQADMVAYDPGTDHARVYGSSNSLPLKSALAESVELYGNGLTSGDYGWNGQSDHAPFDGAGFQACLLIEGEVWNNPYYHTQQDNFDNPNNLNFPYAVKMVRSVVGFVVDYAGVDVPVDTLEFAYPDGRPDFIDPQGGTTVRVEVTGVGASVPQPGTGVLHYDTGGGWQKVAMEVVAEDVYDAILPAGECGQEVFYFVSAEDTGDTTFTDPWNAPDDAYSAVAAYGRITFFEDDFEIDKGWSVSGNATDGQWQRGIPAGGGDRGDPPTDYDDSGKCYVTDNADGNSDVDDGYTYLTSPLIDLSETEAEVHYALWYTNNVGDDPNNDLFKTYVSNNNGATWVLAETVGPMTASGWTEHGFVVSDYVMPTAQMRMRFEASDLGNGSVVEAGIDAFSVFEYDCAPVDPGDLDGDGDVDAADLANLLGNWGPCDDEDPCPADFNGDGVVGAFDLAVLLGNWGP